VKAGIEEVNAQGPSCSTVVDLLRARARDAPERTAYGFLVDGEGQELRWSYGQLDERARAVAARLRRLGVAEGDRVLLLLPPGLDYLAAFFGSLYSGAIAVPAYPPAGRHQIERLHKLAKDCGAKVAWIATGASRLRQGLEGLEGLRWTILEEVDLGLAEEWVEPRIDAGTLAFLQYTSGSTSTPRGVMVSHGNLLHNSMCIRERARTGPACQGVSWLPPYHDMGLIGGILQPLFAGFPMTLMAPVAFLQRPLRWLEAVSRTRATTSPAPTFAFDLVARRARSEDLARLDLSCWESAIVGAEPVQREVLERFVRTFEPCGFRAEALQPSYGLAEATLMVTSAAPGTGYATAGLDPAALEHRQVVAVDGARGRALVSSGPEVRDLAVAVVDPESRRLAGQDRIGEVWVRGPSVAQGYWRDPAATEETFHARLADTGEGPFLRTGDLGFVRGGELYVTGRIKDLILIRGANHYPQDLELTVEGCHPALRPRGGAAFSIEVDGEERLAMVHEVRRSVRRPPVEEVAAAIRQAIAAEHQIEVEAVVLLRAGSLPRTSSGKVRRLECRRAFLAGALDPLGGWWRPQEAPAEGALRGPGDPLLGATPGSDRGDLEGWLRHRVAELAGLHPSQVDVLQPFARFGLDSRHVLGLSGELEERLGQRLSPVLLYDHPTIASLARHLSGEPAPAAEDRRRPTRPPVEGEVVAIVGLGCRFPGAADPGAFAELLRRGGDAVRPAPAGRFSGAGGAAACWGGFLDEVGGFDAEFFGITPREARLMDPQQRLLLEVAWEALEDAGKAPDRLAGSSTGVFVGLSTHDYSRLVLQRSVAVDAYMGTGGAASVAANRLSYLLDLRGPSLAVDTACSSSLVALHLAVESLLRGECDLALAGGVNLILTPDLTATFTAAGMLSPTGRCRAFSAGADGYVRGEGCGVVVLERLQDARDRGDRILALVRGSAVNQDGRSNGLTAPSGPAQRAVIRAALERAGLEPADIGSFEAHGTGTPLGDPIEFHALREVFAGLAPGSCALGSVKTNVGHLEAAAGIAGVIKQVLALRDELIPPHLHGAPVNPRVDLADSPFFLPAEPRPWPRGPRPRRAGVSSFGFGGTNSHVVLEEGPPLPAPAEEIAELQVVPLSARSETGLRELARRYARWERREGSLADLAFTTQVGRCHWHHRLAVVAASVDELAGQLELFAGDPAAAAVGPRSEGPPRIAFLFSGQGAQYPGMGRELYDAEPVFRGVLERCDELLRPTLGASILGLLYGGEMPGRLHETGFAQPALFALEVALAALWCSWGIEPEAVLGHSVGELAAATVAGVFELDEGLRLVAERGRRMQALAPGGAMAAVAAPEERVLAALSRGGGEVVVAAVNGPRSTVLSGPREAAQEVVAALAAEGIEARWLEVSHAFHSPQVDPALPAIEQCARELCPRPPRVQLVSGVTGEPVGLELLEARYWSRQARRPVRFAAAVAGLLREGFDAFVEIGPRPVLVDLGRRLETGREERCEWLPSLREGRPERRQLLTSLARLYQRGATVRWEGLHRGAARHKVSLPTYPFERRRHWVEGPPAVAPVAAAVHPLLGAPVRLPAQLPGESRYVQRLGPHHPAYLGDHRILGEALLPAAAFLEIAAAAGRRDGGAAPLELQGVEILRPLWLPEAATREVHTVLSPGPEGGATSFSIYSRDWWETPAEPLDAEPAWTLHATGTLCRSSAPVSAGEAPMPEGPVVTPGEPLPLEEQDRRLRRMGLEYGPSFRALTALYQDQGQILARLRLPEPLRREGADGYELHPVLLDAAFQALGARSSADPDEAPYLPVAVERLEYRTRPAEGVELWCRARIRAGGEAGGGAVTADLDLFGEDGGSFLRITGLGLRQVQPDSLRERRPRGREEGLYRVEWRPRRQEPTPPPATAARWLILSDTGGQGEELARCLEERGADCTLVFPGAAAERLVANRHRVDPRRLEPIAEVLAAAGNGGWRGVVHLWSLDMPAAEGPGEPDLEAVEALGCWSALGLVQILTRGLPAVPALYLVTRGAQPVPASAVHGDTTTVPGVFQSPLWGLGKVIALEHPELRTVCIDLDPTAGGDEPRRLAAELESSDGEDLVAYRGGERLVARLVRIAEDGPRPAGDGAPQRLQITRPGDLDSFVLAPLARRAPRAGEIEIRVRASGLNFKNLLEALGLVPMENGWFGGECAGEVVAVGDGVAGLRPGDPVVALVPDSFGAYAVADARLAAPKPGGLSFEEAATVPVTFLTAVWALERAARVGAGDRVLIHAAAGGVGLAAIQLARRAGAEVFATASPSKHGFLASLGVRHVFNSRTLDFADQIRERTGGRGVDVVLNSLAGEFIDGGLSVLAPEGRFVEIGRLGIWSPEQVAARRPDVAYHVFDLGRTSREEPEWVSRTLRQLVAELESGDLEPLPHEAFAVADAVRAFRRMEQARHRGKIVLSQPAEGADTARRGFRLDAAASYLITGGLGDLGLLTARFLVGKGARHLVLVGRSAPSPPAVEVLEELEGAGVEVVVERADVADYDQLAALFARLEDRPWPLRGIVHAAGQLADGALAGMEWEPFRAVLAPKVRGGWNLHRLAAATRLDFFVVYSSLAALLGSPGQGNYAAANAFLDALALHRRGRGEVATSIHWGPWRGTRMAAAWEASGAEARRGVGLLPLERGLELLEEVFERMPASLAVAAIDWQRLLEGRAAPPFLAALAGSSGDRPPANGELLSRLAAAPGHARRALLGEHVHAALARVVGLGPGDRIEPRQRLFDLGVDSLMAVELRSKLGASLGLPIPATLLFDHPTLDALVDHLAGVVAEHLGDGAAVREEPPESDPTAAELEGLSEAEAEALLLEELARHEGEGVRGTGAAP
jgi:myxalamid-type polyketide synthase MxaB